MKKDLVCGDFIVIKNIDIASNVLDNEKVYEDIVVVNNPN